MLQSTPRICLISWSFSISTRTNIHRTKMKDLYLIARNLYPINKINIQKKIYYGKRNMCVCVREREREREREVSTSYLPKNLSHCSPQI